MAGTVALNVMVDADAKEQAEAILNELGISLSLATELYLKEIVLTGGIPFPVRLPEAPRSVNADAMTRNELTRELERGIEAARNGQAVDAAAAFESHRRNR